MLVKKLGSSLIFRLYTRKRNKMIKQTILFLLLIQLSHGSTLTLKNVLASADNNNALTQAIDE
jgi:hypothetical protein